MRWEATLRESVDDLVVVRDVPKEKRKKPSKRKRRSTDDDEAPPIEAPFLVCAGRVHRLAFSPPPPPGELREYLPCAPFVPTLDARPHWERDLEDAPAHLRVDVAGSSERQALAIVDPLGETAPVRRPRGELGRSAGTRPLGRDAPARSGRARPERARSTRRTCISKAPRTFW